VPRACRRRWGRENRVEDTLTPLGFGTCDTQLRSRPKCFHDGNLFLSENVTGKGSPSPVTSMYFTSTRAESMIVCAVEQIAFARSTSIGFSLSDSDSSVANR
jgi:hypothetical protein